MRLWHGTHETDDLATVEPYFRGFFHAAYARPEALLKVVLLDLAACQSFDVREAGDSVEAYQVIGDQVCADIGVKCTAFLDASAA